jgi:hypothetical protein
MEIIKIYEIKLVRLTNFKDSKSFKRHKNKEKRNIKD